MTNEEILAALEGGKTYLLAHGWTQGKFRRGERVCAVGALVAAQGQALPESSFLSTTPGLGNALIDILPAQNALIAAVENGTISIANFNDLSTTTEADIHAAYDKAILSVKQRIADEG